MNLDQVLVEADSSSSSDLEILDDTDDVVPDTGTDNTFQEAEEAKAIEERVSFSNFSCMFLNPNIFSQFECELFYFIY